MLRFLILTVVFMAGAFSGAFSGACRALADGSLDSLNSWAEAKALYDAGKFEEAVKAFKAHPGEDASYYYNLGTAYDRAGNPGSAVAYLEKASHLEPHNLATQHNLRMARGALGQIIGHERIDPASTWIEIIADRVPIDEVRGTLGLFGCILVLLWTRSYLKTRRLRRTLLRPAAILSILGLVVSLGLYLVEKVAVAHPPAVFTEQAAIRSGPGNRYLELAQAPTGSKVRVLSPNVPETNGGDLWYQVRYAPDGVGWARASSLLLL